MLGGGPLKGGMMIDEDDHIFALAGKRSYDFLRAHLPKKSIDLAYYLVFSITPEVPRSVWLNFHRKGNNLGLARAALLTVVFTFIFTSGFAMSDGRFWRDSDPHRLQFLEDAGNVILYGVVCPAYVALCTGIMGVATQFWAQRIESPDYAAIPLVRIRPYRSLIGLLIVFAGSSVMISKYQYDLIYNQHMTVQYWFITMVNGVRIPNMTGFYYLLLNFCLLCVTLLGVLSYISLAGQAIRDARNIRSDDDRDPVAIVGQFYSFQYAAALARLLVICYMLNTLVWRFTPMADATQTNIFATFFMIIAIGVAGTWLPRFYVEHKLADLRAVQEARGVRSDALKLVPGGERWMHITASTLRIAIPGLFFAAIYPVLDPQGWLLDILKKVIGQG